MGEFMFTGQHRNLNIKVPYGAQFIQDQRTLDYVLVFHLSEIGKLFEWHKELGKQLLLLARGEQSQAPVAVPPPPPATDDDAEAFERELAEAELQKPDLTPELAPPPPPTKPALAKPTKIKASPPMGVVKPVDNRARSLTLTRRPRFADVVAAQEDASGDVPGATEQQATESEPGQWQLLKPTEN